MLTFVAALLRRTAGATRLAACVVLGMAMAAAAESQSIAVNAGGTTRAVVAPNGKLSVPIMIDLADAGALNIAALQATLIWGTARLTFDSIRVNPGLGWSFTSNIGNAASGALNFNSFDANALPATSTVATAYFTASASAGGTLVLVIPTGAGNAQGGDILTSIRPRSLDVCVGTLVKWGDVNASGVVDILDAQQITRFSAGLSIANPTAMAQRGDVNASGAVDIIDAQQIARFSVGLAAAARINTDFVPVANPTAVTVSPPGAHFLALGSSTQLIATPAAAGVDLTGCAPVNWSSSDPTVATVNSSGYVTAVAAGTTTISAASASASGQLLFTVTAVPVASVDVAFNAPAIQVGTSTQSTATTFDAGHNVLSGRPVSWSSNNTAVATVNSATGVVTGVSAGSAIIFATSGGITGQGTITVTTGVPVASITVALGTNPILTSATTAATATARDASNNVIAATVAWTSSNPAVATVNPSTGLVTGVSAGTATITATANGVSGQTTVTVNLAPVASVTVSLPSFVQVGSTAAATATARDAGNHVLNGATFSWTSSNSAVANVNATTGVITGVSAGTATIFATSGGVTGQANITSSVQSPIATVTVSFGAPAIQTGASTLATAVARDGANAVVAGAVFTWASSNTSIATVNAATGVVTGVATGNAVITATTGGASGQAIIVVGVPVASVAVSFGQTSVQIGSTTNATATTKDAGANLLTGRVVAWSSSNNSIATVNAATGVVTALTPGTANIVATSEGVTGQSTVTAIAVPVSTIAVALGSTSITKGSTTSATGTARDAATNILSGIVLTWSSSNTAVATVNSSGLVTAVAPGTANIVAASGVVTGLIGITVTAPPVASVAVAAALPTIQTGATTTATATPKDASNNTLTGLAIVFSSSNTAIATVNSTTGVITGVAAGNVNITATVSGVTGQVSVTVVVVTSNEPAGMTMIEDRPFNCAKPTACESNWIYEEGPANSMTIVSDPTAPKSPGNVAQMNYFTTLPGGVGPANAEYDPPENARKRTLYISAWIKYSANFQSHPTSINKEIHLFVDGRNKIFSMAYGDGTATGALRPAFGLQGLPVAYNDGRGHIDVSPDLLPNVNTTKNIVRGQWQHHEIIVTANTPGNADGGVQMWLDGVMVINYTGVTFVTGSSTQSVWDTIKWNPTWGGTGGTITAQFYMQMDDIYMSVK